MKTSAKYAAAAAGVILTASAAIALSQGPAFVSNQAANSTQRCEVILNASELEKSSEQCQAPSTQVTWANWLRGESRSTQFHFFDLLELLFSSSEERASQQSSSYNGQTSL
ncbi:hypothetical protein DFP83_10689 [Idiomarina fontislapidosi]|uniref:Uncharacterized protein n=1 Tax=Idiomarina fontislapidosi TaxID=263723 RepID=A0A432Y7W4_9GAMM|nr:hypothetical protein [Idiomarina fontislapidosi]PYE32364.1 hypothetical protein DFP83_10689 [Idiomarina fontislapidosi]RUO57069.1 hypothetical protein CWE25_05170 [Idiomarina fontislapidosi]